MRLRSGGFAGAFVAGWEFVRGGVRWTYIGEMLVSTVSGSHQKLEHVAVESRVIPSLARSRSTWLGIALLALLLLPAALFPPGGDAALYYVSGQKILHQGAAHYRDIVDVKPPLIYHLYAAAAAIFGSTVWSFRLLDYLLQLVTALGIGALVGRYSSRRRGFVAALVYVIFYCAQSFNGTAITESYVGLLAIPMIALQLRRRNALDFIVIGALAGLLFLLKYSLATPLAAAIAAELLLFAEPLALRLRNAALAIGGFLVSAAMLPLYLAITDGWAGFGEMNAFIAGYMRNQSPGLAAAVQEALTALPSYFADEYSLTLLAASVAGVLLALRSTRVVGERDRETQLLGLATINAALMIVGVVIEQKYRAFHLSRLLPYAAILSSAGLAWIVSRVRAQRPLGRYGRLALMLALPVALALSPLSRYALHGAGALLWVTRGDAGFDRLYPSTALGYSFVDLRTIGEHIRGSRAPGDELYVSGSVAGLVHAFADDVPASRIYHSAFLIAPYAPPMWREEIRRFILERQPRFVVVQLRDSMEEMTGTRLSSEGALRSLPGVDSLLQWEYDTAVTTTDFELYERRRR